MLWFMLIGRSFALPFLLSLLAAADGALQAQSRPPRAAASAPVPTVPPPADIPKEERKIPGIAWARKDGRWLGLTREADHLVIRFYDEKKKPEQADLKSVSAHWKAPMDSIETHAVLSPSSDGLSLVAPQLLKLPLTYRIYLTLFLANGKEGETFSIVAQPTMIPASPKPAADGAAAK